MLLISSILSDGFIVYKNMQCLPLLFTVAKHLLAH